MSSSIWTPAALSSDARPLAGTCWRLVEAQHRVSTLKLVDSVDEQEMLEELIQASKPSLPPECHHLHYLLSTPFRYGAVYPTGSRFRRAGLTEGVFYAANTPETAVAEVVFYRLLFYAESPGTPWPANSAEYTAFRAEYGTKRAVDLAKGKYAKAKYAKAKYARAKYAKDGASWMHPTDYAPCQAFAEAARAAGIDVIRYTSVRDPQQGMNVALLTCRAFVKPRPTSLQTWHIRLSAAGAHAVCEQPRSRVTYGRRAFAADPRIAKVRWERP